MWITELTDYPTGRIFHFSLEVRLFHTLVHATLLCNPLDVGEGDFVIETVGQLL